MQEIGLLRDTNTACESKYQSLVQVVCVRGVSMA